MNKEYSPKDIEKKWQDIWDREEAFKVGVDRTKPKYYALVEFPYPSGQGLHVGHPRPYTAMDIVSRKRRMQGYNVLFPMGWDAFGLPTENYAIKNKIHPGEAMDKNLYDLPPEEAKEIPQVAGSLEEALNELDLDREFLKAGGVFTDEAIDAYIALRREEDDRVRMTPHPVEFVAVLQRLIVEVVLPGATTPEVQTRPIWRNCCSQFEHGQRAEPGAYTGT